MSQKPESVGWGKAGEEIAPIGLYEFSSKGEDIAQQGTGFGGKGKKIHQDSKILAFMCHHAKHQITDQLFPVTNGKGVITKFRNGQVTPLKIATVTDLDYRA